MADPRLATLAGFPRRHPVWSITLAALLLLFLVLVLFNWNWLKPPIQRIVSGVTGREFRIDGDLDVDLFPLEVRAEKVYFGNASWSAEPAMARAEHLYMHVRFWPLLRGQVRLPEVDVNRAHLRLERNAQGIGNWMLDDDPRECPPAGCPSRTRILQLTARQGRLEFLEPTFQTAIDLRFDSAAPREGQVLAPLVLRGTGSYRAAPFELQGVVDSPLALQGEAQPYRIDLTARAGGTRGRIAGALAEPLQLEDVAVDFELSGEDLADLYEFTGVVLPPTPPYQLKGRLGRNGARYSYEKFAGTVGDSDLSGDAHFDIGGARPKLTARLTSRRIDFDDLAGFIGGTPGTGAGEEASEKQKAQARKQKATGRLLPDRPINLQRLRAMDADVELTAAKVESRRLPLESMRAHLALVDGELSIDPLEFGAAGGRLASAVRLDGRADPAAFALKMQISRLQLPLLMPRVKQMQDALGTISGEFELAGQGNSTARVLASADGQFGVIMGRGRVSNLLLEIAGLDIAEALAFLIDKDRQVTMRCAYAEFGIEDGIAASRSVAVDTDDTALLLRGEINFRDESLDLTLLPKPKDPSLVSVRTPIRIRGTFANRDIGVKGGPLLARGAAAATLAAITPPLALLALLETGPGKDLGCVNADRAPPSEPPPAPVPKGPKQS